MDEGKMFLDMDDHSGSWISQIKAAVDFVFQSPAFHACFNSLLLGFFLYFADVGTDIANGIKYIEKEDLWWGYLTIAISLLPGFIRGTYELLRRPVIYESASQTFKLTKKYPEIRKFNLGLDVLPQWTITLPNLAVAFFVTPLYLVVMAFWFPVLPAVQFIKCFILQMKVVRQNNDLPDKLHDKVQDEEERAINFKSVESFLEAAPQLFLQLYITLKEDLNDLHIMSFLSIVSSFFSLLKTSYDLQEIDRLDNALSHPKRRFLYFFTSIIWLSSTISFRCLSISVMSYYLSNGVDVQGIALLPQIALAVGNILIRQFHGSSAPFMYGLMGFVAPTRFMMKKVKEESESKTEKYFMTYLAFNTMGHIMGLVGSIVIHSEQSHGLESGQEEEPPWIQMILFPIISLLCVISILSGILHWRCSLSQVFHEVSKYPHFDSSRRRLKTFPKNWCDKVNCDIDVREMVSSGFFCLNMKKGLPVVCYDCGLKVRQMGVSPSKDINIFHASNLLRNRICYETECETKMKAGLNPDILQQMYKNMFRVNPSCSVLKEKNVDLAYFSVRVKSHYSFSRFVSGGARELTEAGFAGISEMTVACYECLTLLDLSSYKGRIYSPWALHAWSKKGFECKFLLKKLEDVKIRMLTFPKPWHLNRNPNVPSPLELSKAGFYCGKWDHFGCGWVKCFKCFAYSFHFPRSEFGREELSLDDIAKEFKQVEFPGYAYGYLGQQTRVVENPVVNHYIQNLDCEFIQTQLTSKEVRVKTFPAGWSDRNNLDVDVASVAACGFIFYPKKNPFKFIAHVKALEPESTTICPVCKIQIDWKTETRHPEQVVHCQDYFNAECSEERFSTLKRLSRLLAKSS